MTKLHVRKGDTVVVLAGKDKGKEGKVVAAFPKKGKVTVEGVSVVKRHTANRARKTRRAALWKRNPRFLLPTS